MVLEARIFTSGLEDTREREREILRLLITVLNEPVVEVTQGQNGRESFRGLEPVSTVSHALLETTRASETPPSDTEQKPVSLQAGSALAMDIG